MPVRRSRAEQLVLVPGNGGTPVTLFADNRDPGELTTQDVFQVSPDGAFLAYAARGALHVRARDGSERTIEDYQHTGEIRFSPDGKYLAAVTGDSYRNGGHRVVVLDLRDGTTRELARYELVRQLEWMPEAVVVLAWEVQQKENLIELPLAGNPRPLLERRPGEIDRFVAAATGTRIVAFVHDFEHATTRVVAVDAAAPASVHQLGIVRDPITNAAASLDGTRVAFTTAHAVFTIAGDEWPQMLSNRADVHSLWFAPDGRLGYASATMVTILDGKRAHQFDSDGPIRMLRFDRTSSRALVAAAHAWDAAGAKPERLAEPGDGSELLGVDAFAGGLVMWSERR